MRAVNLLSAAALAACLSLPGGGAHGAELRVRVISPAPAGLPEQITGEISQALDAASHFSVRGPRSVCASQAVFGPDGKVTLAWQSQGPGIYRVSGLSRLKEEPATPIARLEAGTVHISNGAFTTYHHPLLAGGMPVEVTVAKAKAPLRLDFADRLYHKDIGQLSFCANPKANIKIVANGPLYATVEVAGGYYRLEQGQAVQHESKPLACYRFTYYRDCPLVRVDMAITQERAFEWQELHVLELRVPAAKSWAGGGPEGEGMINGATGSKSFNRWASLYFDNGAVGLLNTRAAGEPGQHVRLYDSPGLIYVIGPWVAFAGPRAEFHNYLYFGPRNSPRQMLDEVSRSLVEGRAPAVEFQPLEERAKSQRSKTASALPGLGNRTERAVRSWRTTHALADIRALRNVAAARAILSQPPPRRSLPREVPPEVELVAVADGRDAVVTDQLLLAFDRKGRLTSFYQALTETELLVKPCSMFRFVARNPLGVESAMTAHEADQVATECAGGVLRLRYTGSVFGAQPATVDLVLKPNGPSVLWSATATCQGEGIAAWRLDFPVLDGLGRLEGDDTGDAIVAPEGWGRWLPRPTAANYKGRYPGRGAAMQLVGYARDNDTTLGVIARDGRCFTKDFVAARGEDERSFSLEVQHHPENMGRATRCEWPYEVETVALKGDWFALAQHYRAWATTQAWCEKGKNRRRPDTPDWFRKLVWWHHDGVRDGGRLLDTLDRLRQAVPFPLAFHWYGWHSIPFDNFYPDYFPANDYVPGVRARLREWGVRAMPYINGHLWDTQARSYADEGAVRWAMKKPDGSLIIEHWNNHSHSTACPFTDAWQNKMLGVTDRLFREIGVDAVYLDQIGAAAAQLCFDEGHGHPRGGGDYYVAGYWKLLKAVRENARRITPDAALTTEDNAEPYLRYLDGMLMCNNATPDALPFFPAVYHDYVAQFGFYVYEPEIKAGIPFRTKEAMLFHFGAQLGWHGTSWSDAPEHREKFKWLAKLAAYRQLGLDWLGYGDMLHPPRVTMKDNKPLPRLAQKWTRWKSEVEADLPAVTASAWQASDGRIAVFVINVSDQPLRVRVRVPAEAKGRKFIELEPPNKNAGAASVSDHQLHIELAPQSVRMFMAM